MKVIPTGPSSRAARLIFTSWEKRYRDIPDAVVVEGPKAGGHLGVEEEQINDPAFAGSDAFRVHRIVFVRELIQ